MLNSNQDVSLQKSICRMFESKGAAVSSPDLGATRGAQSGHETEGAVVGHTASTFPLIKLKVVNYRD